MSRSKRNAAAEEYFKRAPNYSAEVIDVLFEIADDKRQPRAAAIARNVANIVAQSHKFVLPDYGVLAGVELQDWMWDEVRLPFESVVFEYDAPTREPIEPGDIPAEKRVVVCLKSSGPDGDPIVSILLVAWSSVDKSWVPLPAFAELPFKRMSPNLLRLVEFGEPGRRAFARADAKDLLLADYAQPLCVVVEFCAAMACTNVTTDVIRPNREARAARPASTLFDYHVLMIRAGAEHATSEDHGGTHASPRTHLRRGHIRRLAWGPRVWVNSCVVNPSAIGTVNKDYRVIV